MCRSRAGCIGRAVAVGVPSPGESLCADARLGGIVEGEADDGRRQALLVAVQLADLDLGPGRGVLHRKAGERDVLAQDRRAGRAGHAADLGAADVHAVAGRRRLVPRPLETDEAALRVRLTSEERLAADEVLLVPERDREADAGLERIRLIVEFVAGED